MTKYRIRIIPHLRMLILCLAVVTYGLPVTAHAGTTLTMAATHMMVPDMSVAHCDDSMTERASSDMFCCDNGYCECACAGLSVTMTNIPASSMEIPGQSPMNKFINHLTGIELTRDSPPPQA